MSWADDAPFSEALAAAAARVEAALDALLPPARGPGGDVLPEARLFEAMRYAALGGGKRMRAFLALESARLFDVNLDAAVHVAAAIECVHAYSLVHDDLPCMDDDDLRRGRPTAHRAFDEATAVLAGDALLTLAFEILADEDAAADPFVRCELVRALATAAGGRGMVGGQMIDIVGEGAAVAGAAPTMSALSRLHSLKTGALIACSCEVGPILARASAAQRKLMRAYAHDLGLAFQIRDDLLDVEGDEAALGKTPGKDAAANKATFVTVLGVDAARDHGARLADQAAGRLAPFSGRGALLQAAARFAIDRLS